MGEVVKARCFADHIEIEAEGFHGPACQKKLDEILQDLKKRGIHIAEKARKNKPEYFQPLAAAEKRRQVVG